MLLGLPGVGLRCLRRHSHVSPSGSKVHLFRRIAHPNACANGGRTPYIGAVATPNCAYANSFLLCLKLCQHNVREPRAGASPPSRITGPRCLYVSESTVVLFILGLLWSFSIKPVQIEISIFTFIFHSI